MIIPHFPILPTEHKQSVNPAPTHPVLAVSQVIYQPDFCKIQDPLIVHDSLFVAFPSFLFCHAIHSILFSLLFLFSPERARTPLHVLSGGERNRVMLAKLFLLPSNVLVLDEPTNDLDVETLELLEEQLMNYEGTLLLVSHDRAFLNNIVTSTLVLEGEGSVGEYVGGYDDWFRYKSEKKSTEELKKITPAKNQRKITQEERKELNLSCL